LRFRSPAAPVASAASLTPPGRGVTRRRLLATGGAAGAAAAFGGLRLPANARAADQGVPDYLVRSPYMALSTPNFAVAATSAKLTAVTDLPGLEGSEDAFSLTFATSGPIEPGIQAFSHPDLGQFELFIAPVERSGAYEVVVNRSVNAPKHYPRPAHPGASGGPAAPPRPGDKPPKGSPHVKHRHVNRVGARRLARGFACDVALTPGADVKSAVVWIARGGLVVATTEVKHVHGRRIAVSVPTAHRPRGGHYVVTVRTKDRHGHVEYDVAKLALN
jgi:hypothetical protein